jgi:hypothetical protein
MRKAVICLGSLLWITIAILMPMAALEPVPAAHATLVATMAEASCSDGSASLAMGCESIHL